MSEYVNLSEEEAKCADLLGLDLDKITEKEQQIIQAVLQLSICRVEKYLETIKEPVNTGIFNITHARNLPNSNIIKLQNLKLYVNQFSE